MKHKIIVFLFCLQAIHMIVLKTPISAIANIPPVIPSVESRQNKYNPLENEYVTYLFACFKGNHLEEEKEIRYVISTDGYNYQNLNNNESVLNLKCSIFYKGYFLSTDSQE